MSIQRHFCYTLAFANVKTELYLDLEWWMQDIFVSSEAISVLNIMARKSNNDTCITDMRRQIYANADQMLRKYKKANIETDHILH